MKQLKNFQQLDAHTFIDPHGFKICVYSEFVRLSNGNANWSDAWFIGDGMTQGKAIKEAILTIKKIKEKKNA
jgi:hypothetical protein